MPAMRNLLTTACLVLATLSAACKNEAAKPAAPTAPPAAPAVKPAAPAPSAAPTAAAVPGAAAAPVAADVKALLTEDKVARFATYQKEISAVTAEAVGMGMKAYQKAGADQKKMEKAIAADDRTAKIAAASKAALDKSGLTQDEVTRLSQVLTPYYARAYAMEQMFKPKGTAKKPAGANDIMAKIHEGQMAQLETARKEFSDKYGADALAVVRKHEEEFMAINEKIMGAAMGALGGKK
jgi:hypothetical protein